MLRLLARRPSPILTTRPAQRSLSFRSSRLSYPYPPLLRPNLTPASIASFHSTRRNEGLPLIFASVLKASTALEVIRTAGRVILSFAPLLLFKNRKSKKILRHQEIHGTSNSEDSRIRLLRHIKTRTRLFHMMMAIPALLFWATIFASMERTPLTGRWRMIILSPEEEDDIASQLEGPGWYQAVGEILAQDGNPRVIPLNDWRYQWVRDTLRKLEETIPILMRESDVCPDWIDRVPPEDMPLPPPAEYPLRPRPRASEYLRWVCESMCNRNVPPVPHTIPGPPYSLLVVDKADSSNAFSYGFGPNGGGGIVVYSGFLDEILSRTPPASPSTPPELPQRSWLSSLFGGAIQSSPTSYQRYSVTEEQTSQLAILLAHELAHLVLSHHLETLSSATVFIPGTLSIVSDVVRVLIFPITMLFGPFVNDAVAQLGKMGSGEFAKIGEYCTSMSQEIEADVVSARLLAHAGFDARSAVDFWENKGRPSDCGTAEGLENAGPPSSKVERLAHSIAGSSHPVNEVRVESLKAELIRWETERRAAVARLKSPPVESSIVLAMA